MRFLDKGDGEETHSESILDIGVEKAFKEIYFDSKKKKKRKGDYFLNNLNDESRKCSIRPGFIDF